VRVLILILIAFVGAVPLVLGESYIIIMFLTRAYLLGQASVDLFDAVSSTTVSSPRLGRLPDPLTFSFQVLLARNHRELVSNGRAVSKGSSGGGKVTKLGKAITKPLTGKWFMSVDGIVRYVLSLPLNFIPVVGIVFFLGELPGGL
jgi:hypothetical protein